METLAPIPEIGKNYWFYMNDRIKLDSEFEARVLEVYPFAETDQKFIYKYDDWLEEVVAVPLMDLWIEEAADLFWILSENTDYIIELQVPELCPQHIFLARTVDGDWHSFETFSSKQFGLLDITGEYHNKLHK